ncbi:hypothetical protein, partial [Paramagnetospirillum marisnigri]
GREAVQTFKIVVGEAGQGNVAPAGGEGQGQDQGQPQGAPQPGQTGDARPVGRPSLSDQLRAMSKDGRLARHAALFGMVKQGGRAA